MKLIAGVLAAPNFTSLHASYIADAKEALYQKSTCIEVVDCGSRSQRGGCARVARARRAEAGNMGWASVRGLPRRGTWGGRACEAFRGGKRGVGERARPAEAGNVGWASVRGLPRQQNRVAMWGEVGGGVQGCVVL
eukprot:365428-Chlamydomonas_euryale.AAC.5